MITQHIKFNQTINPQFMSAGKTTVGANLVLHPKGFVPACKDIHLVVEKLFERLKFPCFDSYKYIATKHYMEVVIARLSQDLVKVITENEIYAIIYYSMEIEEGKGIYTYLNQKLASRKVEDSYLIDYSYYLYKGLEKLPDWKGFVYRGINCSLFEKSSLYVPGNCINSITFLSTTSNIRTMLGFTRGDMKDVPNATCMMFHVTSGKDISLFSIFPEEKEVLLLPNSKLFVNSTMPEGIKHLIGSIIQSCSYIGTPAPSEFDIRRIPTIDFIVMTQDDHDKCCIYYLVRNKRVDLPHDIPAVSSNLSEIQAVYSQQPLWYSHAIVSVHYPEMKMEVEKFYGNPVFIPGMLDLVSKDVIKRKPRMFDVGSAIKIEMRNESVSEPGSEPVSELESVEVIDSTKKEENKKDEEKDPSTSN